MSSDWGLFHYFLACVSGIEFFSQFSQGFNISCAASAWKPWRPGRLWNWSRWWELIGVSQVWGRSKAGVEVALVCVFGRYPWTRVLVVVFIIVGLWSVQLPARRTAWWSRGRSRAGIGSVERAGLTLWTSPHQSRPACTRLSSHSMLPE